MALRVASLDYLGTVAARLRKDAVTSKMDQHSINRILGEVKRQSPPHHKYKSLVAWKKLMPVCVLQSSGGDEIQQLQKALMNYLDENVETDPSLLVRKFRHYCDKQKRPNNLWRF